MAIGRGFSTVLVLASLTPLLLARAAPAVDDGGSDLDFRRMQKAQKAAYHGRFTDALSILDDLIARKPGFGQAYLYRARLDIDIMRLGDAARDLDVVQAMHPDYAAAYFFRAQIDVLRHQPAAALSHLAQASRLPTASVWKRDVRFDNEHTISYWYAVQSLAEQMLGHDDSAVDYLGKELAF